MPRTQGWSLRVVLLSDPAVALADWQTLEVVLPAKKKTQKKHTKKTKKKNHHNQTCAHSTAVKLMGVLPSNTNEAAGTPATGLKTSGNAVPEANETDRVTLRAEPTAVNLREKRRNTVGGCNRRSVACSSKSRDIPQCHSQTGLLSSWQCCTGLQRR
jgi:hypothetical protein